MASQTNDLGTLSVRKLLLRLAAPAIAAQIINALYNIVDRIYIGNMEGVGYLALTGVGLTFPIITLIMAFSNLVGIGGTPLMSMALGQKDYKRAQKILCNCFTGLIAISIVLTVIFQIFKRPFLYAFGASDATIGYAEDYIGIYLFGTVFVMISMGLNSFINAQGFSKTGMATVLIGAVANIILDPIFIFALDMGVKGAALATIISQGISAAWVLKFLFGKKATIRLKLSLARIEWNVISKVMALGVSPFVMAATESLVMISLNSQLQKYGDDYFVGSMTIVSSIMQLMIMPSTGLTQGAQPIISYNFGAGNLDRVRKTFKLLLKCCMIFYITVWILLMLFPQLFISIFNRDPQLMDTAVWALRVHTSMIFAMGVQNSCQNTFIALGQAKISLFLALVRKVILLVPLAFILPLFFDVHGIFFAEPIADITAATITGIMFFFFYKKTLGKNATQTIKSI